MAVLSAVHKTNRLLRIAAASVIEMLWRVPITALLVVESTAMIPI